MSLIKQDAEANLLGSFIVDPSQIGIYRDKLKAEMFGHEPNRIIWNKLVELSDAKSRIDVIILKESMTEEQLLSVGGASFLATLVVNVPATPATEAYFRIVESFFARRKYKELGERLAHEAENSSDISSIDSALAALRGISVTADVPNIESAAESAIERISKEHKEKPDLMFGISGMDELLGGIKRTKLYTLGGKTSHGKTTVAANVILENLKKNEKSVILYDGFENIEDLPVKLASMDSNLPLDWFVKPHLITDDQLDQTILALAKLQQYKDRLLLCNGASMPQVRQICRDKRPDIVMLDYVQKCAMKFGGDDDGKSRFNVSRITSELQDIALDFNCAAFNFSQFKRVGDDRRYKEPDISDLKESGDIENHSDYIVLLWWPWREEMDDRKFRQNDYRFLIRKNKTGPCMDAFGLLDMRTLKLTGIVKSDYK